jgi:hypothetical protein
VADPPQQEDDVGEKTDVEQKNEGPGLFQGKEAEGARLERGGEQKRKPEGEREKSPGCDPVEEGAPPDLLVEQQEEEKKQKRSRRLDEQRKLMYGHGAFEHRLPILVYR